MNGLTNTKVKEIKRHTKYGSLSKALQQLAIAKNDMLSPYDVIEEARNEKSVLHNSFEWDNTKAGEKYRLMQARMLLTTIKVEYMGEKQEAFFNATIQVDGNNVRGYFPIERVMSDEEVRKDVLKQAVRELEYAQHKYNSLKEIKGIINTKKLQAVKEKIQ